MTDSTTNAPRRGRPLLGAFAGLFLGLFVALDLILFGLLPLESGLVWVIAVAGIVLGVALGVWAPFGRGSKGADAMGTADAADAAPLPPPPPAPADPPDDYDSSSITSDGA
mgnify:CR=1 FL=1